MRIHNIYADENGESHFRDLEVEWSFDRLNSTFSEPVNASKIEFRRTEGDYDFDWHPAPRRQYVINLDAGVEVTASDGETRTIGAGEVLLTEDTHGRGHCSKSIDSRVRHCVFVAID